FPTRLAAATPGDFQTMGRNVLFLLGKVLILSVVAGAALAVGALAALVSGSVGVGVAAAWPVVVVAGAALVPLIALAFQAFAVGRVLAAEGEGPTPTTAQVAERTAKVVRELGQPALAEAYAEFGRRRVRAAAPPQADPAAPGAEVVFRFPRGASLREMLPACV